MELATKRWVAVIYEAKVVRISAIRDCVSAADGGRARTLCPGLSEYRRSIHIAEIPVDLKSHSDQQSGAADELEFPPDPVRSPERLRLHDLADGGDRQ